MTKATKIVDGKLILTDTGLPRRGEVVTLANGNKGEVFMIQSGGVVVEFLNTSQTVTIPLEQIAKKGKGWKSNL